MQRDMRGRSSMADRAARHVLGARHVVLALEHRAELELAAKLLAAQPIRPVFTACLVGHVEDLGARTQELVPREQVAAYVRAKLSSTEPRP